MPNADQLYVRYKSTQCGSFPIGKAIWIEEPLPLKKLENVEMPNTKSMLFFGMVDSTGCQPFWWQCIKLDFSAL